MCEQQAVPVGIGEFRVSGDPSSVLVAYGLGSCVGVCVYDPSRKVGGLAHVMLPSSGEAAGQRPSAKFADCAIPALVEEVVKLGGGRSRLVGKIAGGAQMLAASGLGNGFNVGERNVEAVRSALGRHNVPLLKADVGGNRGRTLTMYLRSGKVVVRTIGERETEL